MINSISYRTKKKKEGVMEDSLCLKIGQIETRFFEKLCMLGLIKFYSGENIAFALPPSFCLFLRRGPDFNAVVDIFVASKFLLFAKKTDFVL